MLRIIVSIFLALTAPLVAADATTRVGLLSGALRGHAAVMLMIVPETGEIIDANEAAARFYGFPIAQLVGRRISEFNLLQPDEVTAERARAAREERNYFLFPHRVADGSVRTGVRQFPAKNRDFCPPTPTMRVCGPISKNSCGGTFLV